MLSRFFININLSPGNSKLSKCNAVIYSTCADSRQSNYIIVTLFSYNTFYFTTKNNLDHTLYYDLKGVPVVFILSQRRTIVAYDAIWDEILSLASDLPKNLKLIHSDFEDAAINVFKKKFPKARLVGCWFHFNQVLFNVTIPSHNNVYIYFN